MTISPQEHMGGFWTFESPLESHLEVPTLEELSIAWQKYHQAEPIALQDGLFGILELPKENPRAIISLDLCEVLRETGPAVTRMYSHNDADFLHDYGIYYGDSVLGSDAQGARSVLFPHLMHMNSVRPVPFSEAITAFMHRWRENGVHIIANTSTLPGCEVSTVRFLSEQYPRTAQGILFPRNHDGKGTTTKAAILQHAKERITTETGFDLSHTPTIAIEDAHHHAVGYIDAPSETHVIMPAYSWNTDLDEHPDVTRVEQGFGTLDAFIATDNYLVEHGILK